MSCDLEGLLSNCVDTDTTRTVNVKIDDDGFCKDAVFFVCQLCLNIHTGASSQHPSLRLSVIGVTELGSPYQLHGGDKDRTRF